MLRRVALHERNSEDQAPGHTIGDIEIREAEAVVLRDGVPVELTKTEFRLLCELAAHPNMVLTRDQLLERVWGYDYLGDGRLVDAHMHRLRAKIDVANQDPLIATVRGIGYKLQKP